MGVSTLFRFVTCFGHIILLFLKEEKEQKLWVGAGESTLPTYFLKF